MVCLFSLSRSDSNRLCFFGRHAKFHRDTSVLLNPAKNAPGCIQDTLIAIFDFLYHIPAAAFSPACDVAGNVRFLCTRKTHFCCILQKVTSPQGLQPPEDYLKIYIFSRQMTPKYGQDLQKRPSGSISGEPVFLLVSLALKSAGRNTVWVRPPPALHKVTQSRDFSF